VALAHHKPDRTDAELDQVAAGFAAGPFPADPFPAGPSPEIFVAAEGGILDL
jgi:hypothetical protein